ncbi:YjjW family glycine radical enzyme activase [Ancylomarina salipaludis]|nr:YjjW family glycine radical enzyme activase [Ancylomarina salipaludis]
MSELQANISGIIKSSVIDGPGNRMVIFFQACNLNCLYCHNSHTIGLCNLCGLCVQNCPTQSLKIDASNKQIIHNASTCTHCDNCLKNCPENSSPFYKKMTVEHLISEIEEVKDFISGITVSGGEVMLQSEFLKQLFISIKTHPELNHLSILVDSNGNIDENRWNQVLDWVDGFMLDIKAYSSDVHKKITGHTNEKILNSIRYLDSKNKLSELRLVLVPGYNNSKEEIETISGFMQSLSPEVRKVLIKLRKHGIREKYHYLSEPTQLDIAQAVEILESDKHKLLVI